ncbi:MAG: hydrogen peroxide-dependent heme synthase [Acidobacteriota bacterium]
MTQPIHSEEGWFVLHVFYTIDRQRWSRSPEDEKEATQKAFEEILRNFTRPENCQAHCYSVWGHKADLALLLVDPDLDRLNQAENDVLACFPDGVLQPTYSFVSMSEISEYMSQEKDHDKMLRKQGLSPDSQEYQQKMETFRQRMRHYINERLHPQLPEHRVMCFYPMNKKRGETVNWYHLDFDKRKAHMAGHMITGRKYAGKVQQLVTGSMGLDAWEWGVTLFSNDPFYLKKIVYEMRYDEVSAVYAEFGDFIVGLHMEPDGLFERLRLTSRRAVPAS